MSNLFDRVPPEVLVEVADAVCKYRQVCQTFVRYREQWRTAQSGRHDLRARQLEQQVDRYMLRMVTCEIALREYGIDPATVRQDIDIEDHGEITVCTCEWCAA